RLRSSAGREIVRTISKFAGSPLDTYQPRVLVEVLVAAFADLDYRSPTEIEQLVDVGPLTEELVRLYRLFRTAIEGRYQTASDVFRSATLALNAGARCAPCVVVVVEPPGAFQTELLNALNDAGLVHLVTIGSGDEQLDAAIEPWLWGMQGVAAP